MSEPISTVNSRAAKVAKQYDTRKSQALHIARDTAELLEQTSDSFRDESGLAFHVLLSAIEAGMNLSRSEICESLAEEAEREAERLMGEAEKLPVPSCYQYNGFKREADKWKDRAAWLRSKGVEQK